jgi:hypothetical protein
MGKEKYSVIFVLSKTDDISGQINKIHPRTFHEDVGGRRGIALLFL